MPFVIPKAAAVAAAATVVSGPITVPIDRVELIEEYKQATRSEYVCNVKPRFIRYTNFERVEYVRECGQVPVTITVRDPKFKIFFKIDGRELNMVVSEVPGRTITLK